MTVCANLSKGQEATLKFLELNHEADTVHSLIIFFAVKSSVAGQPIISLAQEHRVDGIR